MPQYRPAYNASISRYSREQVTVIYVRPRTGPRLLVVSAPWGPYVVNPALEDDTPDLESYRRLYLQANPAPSAEPVRGPSVYERLRRPEL